MNAIILATLAILTWSHGANAQNSPIDKNASDAQMLQAWVAQTISGVGETGTLQIDLAHCSGETPREQQTVPKDCFYEVASAVGIDQDSLPPSKMGSWVVPEVRLWNGKIWSQYWAGNLVEARVVISESIFHNPS